MESHGSSAKPKDQAAKKSGGAPGRKAGQADKPGIANQQVQAGKNARRTARDPAPGGRGQGGGAEHKQSAMALANEGAVDVDAQEVDAQALPGIAIAENSDERHRKISAAAYARAERRGFEPGREEEDWLSAEAELYGDYTRDGEDEDGKPEQWNAKQRKQIDSQ